MSTNFADLRSMLDHVAQQHGIPADLFRGQILQESGGNPRAVSSVGAKGLGQLMPDTAKELGVTDPFDPFQNLDGSARYLRDLYRQTGNWDAALTGYHSGMGNVKKAGFGTDPNWLQNMGGPHGRNYARLVRGRMDDPFPNMQFGQQPFSDEGKTAQARQGFARMGMGESSPQRWDVGGAPPGMRFNENGVLVLHGQQAAPSLPSAPSPMPAQRPGDGAFGSGIANSFDPSVEQAMPWLKKPQASPFQPPPITPGAAQMMAPGARQGFQAPPELPVPQPPPPAPFEQQVQPQPQVAVFAGALNPDSRFGSKPEPDPRGSLVEQGNTYPAFDINEFLANLGPDSRFGSKPEPSGGAYMGDVQMAGRMNSRPLAGAPGFPTNGEMGPPMAPMAPEQEHPAVAALRYHMQDRNPQGLLDEQQRQRAAQEMAGLLEQRQPSREDGILRLAQSFAAGGHAAGVQPLSRAYEMVEQGFQDRDQAERQRMQDISGLMEQDRSTRYMNFQMKPPDTVTLPDGQVVPASQASDFIRAQQAMDPERQRREREMQGLEMEDRRSAIDSRKRGDQRAQEREQRLALDSEVRRSKTEQLMNFAARDAAASGMTPQQYQAAVSMAKAVLADSDTTTMEQAWQVGKSLAAGPGGGAFAGLGLPPAKPASTAHGQVPTQKAPLGPETLGF